MSELGNSYLVPGLTALPSIVGTCRIVGCVAESTPASHRTIIVVKTR
jgi:hypothetical protein